MINVGLDNGVDSELSQHKSRKIYSCEKLIEIQYKLNSFTLQPIDSPALAGMVGSYVRRETRMTGI